MTHYVILGASAAGLTALDWIRQRDRTGPVTLVTKEPTVAYSRVALPYYLAGKKDLRQITLHPDSYFKELGVDYRVGAAAARLDVGARQVILEDGSRLGYDRLLIATGSLSSVPPIQGIEDAYVSYHWTLADADRIREATASAKRVVVIGAGFISLLTVTALLDRGLDFTVVEIADQVMPALLDREAAAMLEQRMRQIGIEVMLGETVTGVSMPMGGKGRVTLASGKALDADAVIVGAGVKANVDFLRGGQLEINRGIVVDRQMRTNLPDVWAAGDCAETHDFLGGERVVHAIWPTAIEQGRIAGANMAGDEGREYAGSLSMNVTELFGLSCASVGEFRERDGLEPIVHRNEGTGLYRKLLLNREGTIQGIVTVGQPDDVQDIGVVQHMIRTRKDVLPFKDELGKERVNYGRLVHTGAGMAINW